MLTPFTTTDGREIWINPVHVKAVRGKTGLMGGKKPGTEIWLSWESTSEAVTVPDDVAEVAEKLNANMPEVFFPTGDSGSSSSASD